jgi:hypothetical protein
MLAPNLQGLSLRMEFHRQYKSILKGSKLTKKVMASQDVRREEQSTTLSEDFQCTRANDKCTSYSNRIDLKTLKWSRSGIGKVKRAVRNTRPLQFALRLFWSRVWVRFGYDYRWEGNQNMLRGHHVRLEESSFQMAVRAADPYRLPLKRVCSLRPLALTF